MEADFGGSQSSQVTIKKSDMSIATTTFRQMMLSTDQHRHPNSSFIRKLLSGLSTEETTARVLNEGNALGNSIFIGRILITTFLLYLSFGCFQYDTKETFDSVKMLIDSRNDPIDL